MKKIKLEDAGKKPLEGTKKKYDDNFFIKTARSIKYFFSDLKEELDQIKYKEVIKTLSQFNLYRRVREFFIRFYLKRNASLIDSDAVISWQSFFLILIKVIIVGILSYQFYLYHTVLAEWIEQGFLFFRLHEIYNFTFPGKKFFNNIAQYIFLFIIAYYGFFFAVFQLQALFSSVTVSKKEEKIYYIKSYFILKNLYIFSVPEIDLIVLKHNLLFRLLGIGTLVLHKKSGEQIIIRHLKRASRLLRIISSMKRNGE